MGFFKNLFSSTPRAGQANIYTFSLQCDRCNERIEGRINLDNDLTLEYGEQGDGYYIRKVLIGNNTCFQRIEVELKFDASKHLLEKQASGGQFV